MSVDAALFNKLNDLQRESERARVHFGVEGYSEAEISAIERKWKFQFPSDLKFLLRNVHDEAGYFTNWRGSDAEIQAAFNWPREGLAFDIEHAGFWLTIWDPKPPAPGQRLAVLDRAMATWPRLIPVRGNCYLPAEPSEPGNPVFWVRQSEIVYYGAELADFLIREFMPPPRYDRAPIRRDRLRYIRVWSDLSEDGMGL